MTTYLFKSTLEAAVEERYALLDALYNPRTFRFLETTGIAPGWHCLEIGGGSGAVAGWMADRVGPSGHVLVTDVDLRVIERSARGRPANLEVRRHDIGADPLPGSAFDLIHARLVLCHVPQREAALATLVAALKPGGWLVLEEFDGRLVDRAIPIGDAEEAARYRRMSGALTRLLDEHGYDIAYPRGLFGRLKAAGLAEVGMEGHLAVREGGSLGARFEALNFTQVRAEAVAKGLITDPEVDAVLSRTAAADFAVFSQVMLTAWGRRPG
jgi:ubiquinone/menaquinone biosynthesis C-methylase UbiE